MRGSSRQVWVSLALVGSGALSAAEVSSGGAAAMEEDLQRRMSQLVWDITGHFGDLDGCTVHGRAFTAHAATIHDNPRFIVLRDWMRSSQLVLPPAKPASASAGPLELEACLGGVDQVLALLDGNGDDIDRLAEPQATP